MAKVTPTSLPFKQQIAFFRNKRNVLTESYLDVWQSEHDNAFMVAGANRIDLVADFRDAVREAIDNGETLENFRARFDSIVAKHGWDYNGGRNWRSRVIYETNLRQSYNAGIHAQQLKLAKVMPYIRYRHNDAVMHPRPIHESWDGKIWRVDDPIWKVIYPANGWGCRCFTEGLSERDMRKLGKSGPDPTPELKWIDVMVGQRSPGGPRLVRTVEGIDPGFAYAPGNSLDTWPTGGPTTPPAIQRTLVNSAQDALRKSTRLSANAASAALQELFALERAQQAVSAGFAEFQADVASGAQSAGSIYFVGMFDDVLMQTLNARGITPATAAIAIGDAEVLQALALGTNADALASLPAALRSPSAVLWDAGRALLVFVSPSGNGWMVTRVAVTAARPEVRMASYTTGLQSLRDLPVLRGAL